MIYRNFYKFIAESERLALRNPTRNLHPDYTLGFPKNLDAALRRKCGSSCGVIPEAPQSTLILIEISK
jgi:hypothetical protein